MSSQTQTSSTPPAAAGVAQSDIMYGWTFHQSHDQATVLFLVPHSVAAKDLEIQIEKDFIIAAVRPYPAIIKAKLYGRINSETSTWRIDERDKARSKRRSRSLTRSSRTTSSNEATSSAGQPQASSSRRTGRTGATNVAGTGDGSDPEGSRTDGGSDTHASPPRSQSSMTTSVASLRSGSSYEVVQHSPLHQSQHISPASAAGWSSGSSEFASSDSADANLSRSGLVSEPDKAPTHTKDPSSEDAYNQSHTRSHSAALSAGNHSESSENSSEQSRPTQPLPHSAQHGPPEARLVTLHLEKIDSGIWPFLVIGPAPVQMNNLSSRLRKAVSTITLPDSGLTETFLADHLRDLVKQRLDRRHKRTAQLQLNHALVEALSNFQGGDRMLASIRRELENRGRTSGAESDEELGPSTSSISINTISSDESSTVLGSRVASLSEASASLSHEPGSFPDRWREDEDESDEDEEEVEAWKELQIEAKFNMDPTTLSLIGLQHVNRRPPASSGILRSLAPPPASGIPEAFEHFARSWRVAEIGLATERLVHDYLPLLPTQNWQSGGSVDDAARSERLKCLPRRMADAAATLPITSATINPALRDCLLNSTYMAQRQRLVASLGGPKALARLYLSYGRLRLPSLAESRSPLAFPYGQLTSPFVSGRDATLHRQSGHPEQPSARKATSVSSSIATSSKGNVSYNRGATSPIHKGADAVSSPLRTNFSQVTSPFHSPPAEMTGGGDFPDFFIGHEQSSESQPGPLYFLLEACLLDEDLRSTVQDEEWAEALEIALINEEHVQKELDGLAQAEEMGSLAGDSQSGCLAFDSDTASRSDRGVRRGKRSRQSKGRRHTASSPSEGTTFFGFLWKPTDSADEQRDRRTYATSGKQKRRRERRYAKHAQEEAGVLNFVSGAALLGVALAGSVAALGWWRRTSALNPAS